MTPPAISDLLQAGLKHYQAGELAQAETAYRDILRSRPDLFQAHYGLAGVLARGARAGEAVASYRAAARLKPDAADIHADLGFALVTVGNMTEAEAAFRAALALKSDLFGAAYNLGNVLAATGRPEQAVEFYRKAVAVNPGYAEAHYNLGLAHFKAGQSAAAIAAYQTAFDLKPESARIADTLGNLLLDGGRLDDAAEVFRRAGDAGAEKLGFMFRACLLLPRIAESVEQIHDARERLINGLDDLARMDGVIHDPPALTNDAFFYLAYGGENDRPVMEAAQGMFRRHSPVLNYVSPHIETTRARRVEQAGPIRIGFLSQFLCSHTIGRLNKGLIAGLDRTKFHVTVIHTAAAKRDAAREAIDRAADATVILPADINAAQQAVADLRLDLLHFPDIGMNAFTYFLAYARLAPVQTMGWGHPDTTGLSTIDYFLSFDTAEAEGAEAHYAETLVRLSRPSVYYEPDAKVDPKPDRAEFGLPATGALYGCLQSLFKFHPDFDAVMAEVLERDPTGRIVLVDWVQPTWRELLRARWARTYPILLERVIFQPRQPGDRFRQLVALMDVMLDPLHFGGGNTFYEALAQGVPTVTWQSPYLRGRLITGFYRLLGVGDGLIAPAVKDFAAMVVTLATNPTRRAEVCAPLMARAAMLYRDEAAVRELEAFFEAVVNADLDGRKITDWRFTPPS